jgi:UDP-N-acetylglucosamine--dolichyl-phosphate N-acetylglucosaminephosphotransferase
MSELIVGIIAAVIAFSVTFLLIPKYIKKASSMGLIGKDMNKYEKPPVPEAGGITVIAGLVSALLFYIFVETFIYGTQSNLISIFAILATLLLAVFIGFVDDILGWKTGIRRINKVLLTIPLGIPFMVINAGQSTMFMPFIGSFNFGLFYPLLIVPLGIICAANAYNMLAGYNGLEAGLGVIILTTLGIVNWINGLAWLAIISFIGVFALLAFLVFNWCPAKIFPGDSMTYGIGAFIAMIAIVGDLEKIGLILFIPFIIDAILSLWPELTGKGKVEAFAKPNEDNSLEKPYKGIHDLTHFALASLKRMKKKVYEKDVTTFILLLELFVVLIVFMFFI